MIETYRVTNYGMGRPIETATVEAASDAEAIRLGEALMKGKHAAVEGGKKGRVIGVQRVTNRKAGKS